MTTATPTPAPTLIPFAEALEPIAMPGWFADARAQALREFMRDGLPGSGKEDWKYTSLAHLERIALHPPRAHSVATVCPDVAVCLGHILAFLNGQLTCHGTHLANQLAGTLQHLADSQMVRRHLGRVAEGRALVNLNQALWQDGVCLHVPAGIKVHLPVYAQFNADEADAMLHPRTLAVVERDGEAVLVEHFLGQTDSPYWQNAVTEIVLEAGAQLTHIRIVEEGGAATHTGLTAVHQARDSRYHALNLTLGGRVVRHDLDVVLAEEGAQASLDGVFIADGRRGADQHLRVTHHAPRTRSRTLYRGLADGRGRGVFDARVVVHSHAAGADARQSSRNLLLSPHAEIDAKPQLEIYTDDVKCGHGATVGRLDEGALFYLKSRGIDDLTARRLLMESFVGEALGLLQDGGLGDWLMPRLLAHLPGQHVTEPQP
jgi:Fe-S cluster assembly protein SufD